jgi:hypothetical protein
MKPQKILSGIALVIGAWIVWRLMDKAAASTGLRQREIDAELDQFGMVPEAP